MKIKVIAVGGTIDKVYFDAKSEFQVGEPQIKEVFDIANVTFKYNLVALIAKDSLDMTDDDRQIIHDYISNCEVHRPLPDMYDSGIANTIVAYE